MTRRSLGGVSALILVAGAVLSYLFLFSDDAPVAPPEALDTAKVTESEPPATRRVSSDAPPATAPALLTEVVDPDPEGPLRLEGQVLGPDDAPVGGAIVRLDSNPPRQALTEDDGSFAFENLVGKSYSLAARADDLVGGPVVHQLSESSDPAVVRLRQGAQVEVEVVSALDGAPVADAMVTLLGPSQLSDTTNRAGAARLRGAAPGFSRLEVSADGFATQTVVVRIPDGATDATRQRVELEPGIIIAGKVVDPSGAPVAGATISARAEGDLTRTTIGGHRDEPVKSGDDGGFELSGVGVGAYRFTATHPKFAPGSSPPIDVGLSGPGEPVVITLELGAAVAGLVVDSKGAPAPWASVRLTGVEPGASHQRQTVAGEDGRFRLEGVSKTRHKAVAETDTAGSELVEIDLSSRDAIDDLTLTLSLEGVISGRVVDGAGEPIAEAQVVAVPDFWAGEDLTEMQHRGPSFATTDGGGQFALRGLAADKKFQLRAARAEVDGAAWQTKGTSAQTGDTDVKLVLPADGKLVGALRSAAGGAPDVAVVSLGFAASAPAAKGKFELAAVRPGTYDVSVRGPDFPEKIITAVEIEPGKTTDLGTIELAAGRRVAGRVTDEAGRPVAGADVVLARQLVGDGRSLTASGLGAAFEQQTGLRRTTSDGGGRFAFKGVGLGDLVMAAEADGRGRSLPAPISASGGGDVTLRLRPFGSIAGTVTRDGKPAAGAQVMVTAAASQKQLIVANTGADGDFIVERIGAGDYTVTARVGVFGGAKTSASVTVPAGARATADVDIKTGDKTLAIAVEGRDGARVDGAQVFLFQGETNATGASDINRMYLSAEGWADVQFAQTKAGVPATFRNVPEGTFTACVIPLTGDLSDQTFMQRINRHAESLKVYCEGLTVASSPSEQSVTRAVPAMEPLPAD